MTLRRSVFILSCVAFCTPFAGRLFAQGTPTVVLVDDFSTGSIDASKWVIGNASKNASAVENGALHLRSTNRSSGWIYTRDRFSLRDRAVQIKVVQPNDDGALGLSPTAQSSSSSGFYAGANWYRFYNYRNNNSGPYRLYVQWSKNNIDGGLDVATQVSFSAPFYLRIRCDAQTIYFEYSFDNSSWNVGYSEVFGLSGYTVDSQYYFELSAYNTPANSEWGVDDFTILSTAPVTDTTPPVISQISATPGNTSAAISWQTDEPATSQINYGLTSSYGSATALDPVFAIEHTLSVTGLQAGTIYHYQIVSTDAAGNTATSADQQLTTLTSSTEMADDFNADTLDLDKWLLGSNSGNLADVQNGALRLRSSGRTGAWIYTKNRYALRDKTIQIKIVQPNGDGALGLSPTVTANSASGFYQENNWYRFYNYRNSTSEPYKLYVQWKKNGVGGGLDVAQNVTFNSNFYLRIRCHADSIAFDYSFDDAVWTNAYREAFALAGRTLDDLYYFEMSAYNTAVNGEWLLDDFTIAPNGQATADTTPPVISQVATGGITATSATITWATDEPATHQVEYGTSPSYGNFSPVGANLMTNHTVTLTNLSPATTYHFRVWSWDAESNAANSGDYTFATATQDLTPPVISAVQADSVTSGSVVIRWQTDELATAVVDFGLQTTYGSMVSDNALQTSHAVRLSNLSDSTGYHYRIRSKDAANNEAIAGDYTFTTLLDRQSPAIIGVMAQQVTASSAVIVWQNDEPAEGRIEYGTSTAYGQTTSWSGTLAQAQQQSLANLQPQTTYHFRVHSRDVRGNASVSSDFVFTTLPTTTTLLADDFNNGSLDANKWQQGANAGNQSYVNNQALELRAQGVETGWVITKTAFVARNTTVSCKVTQPNDDGDLGMSPTYTISATNGIFDQPVWYRFYVYRSDPSSAYRLYAQWRKNGFVDGLDITGNLEIRGSIFMRLRMDDTQIYFEISLDRESWLTSYSEPFALPGYTLDNAFHYELAAYRTASKGTLIIDDFAVEQGGAPAGIPAVQSRIMLVGNSITYGIGSSDGLGFREKLYQQLSNAGYDFAFVGTEGAAPYKGNFFPGKEIDNFYPASYGNGTGTLDITNSMFIYQPAVVMIHLGTNDLTNETFISPYSDDGGHTLNGSTSGQLAQLVKYLLRWHDGTYGTFLRYVFVSEIIPRHDRVQQVPEFNNEVSRLSADFANGVITGNQEPVFLVDHYAPFAANPNLFTGNGNDYMDSDGIHPNDNGYTVMSDTYFAGYAQNYVPMPASVLAATAMAEKGLAAPGPVPDQLELAQNYPNPFSAGGRGSMIGTNINFQLPEADWVKLEIYDILGRRVRTVVDGHTAAGFHRVVWDGRDSAGLRVSTGVYFYLLRTRHFTKSMKMTVVR